jgi:beta-1,4-mannosyl-glycoprotein beta-1,4-N-acetylglucosaminyltransferase
VQDVKVVDTILYNGEPILELRLQLLYNVVDEFVIVEARETFSGIQKAELYIEKHAAIIAPYKSKITFIIVDTFPAATTEWKESHADFERLVAGGTQHWYRERSQRNAAAAYISAHCQSQKCIIMVCDVDELVRPETVSSLKLMYHHLYEPVKLSMRLFYYNFGWARADSWRAAFVVNDVGFKSITPDDVRSLVDLPYFPDTGWHGSYFFNIAGLVRKLQSFSHQEHNVERFTNEAHVKHCIQTGADLFAREDHHWQAFDITSLPMALQQFHNKLMFLQEYS